MIPALPTAAPEMEHHRGFQTFASMGSLDRAAATCAVGTRRAGDAQRLAHAHVAPRLWPLHAGLETQANARAHHLHVSRVAEVSRDRRAVHADHSRAKRHDGYANAVIARGRRGAAAK